MGGFQNVMWGPAADCCGGTGPGPVIGISGCYCQGTPASLELTIEWLYGETPATYANSYQPCTIGYYTSAPPYMPQSAFSGAGYYSTTSWIDSYGFEDYFRLNCYATQWALGFGQRNQDLWQSPGQIYNWSMGASPAVNFCSPFALNVGRTQSGVYFNSKFIVSG